MRLVRFNEAGRSGLGLVMEDELAVVEQGEGVGEALRALISGGSEARNAAEERAASARRISLSAVALEPPVPSRDAAILCVGKNYFAHAKEFFGSGFDSSTMEEVPSAPVIFAKTGSALVGHEAPVHASLDPTGSVDYEGELAVVIGRVAHKIGREEAMNVVFGYTICNDVTSRTLQKRHNQWLIGKSLDTFGPLGPWIVTAEEIGDITARTLETRVNGELRQQASSGDMIWSCADLVHFFSTNFTLRPGMVILTGTPAGTAWSVDAELGGQWHPAPGLVAPTRYCEPGDVVESEIEGIGVLRNPIVAWGQEVGPSSE
jgi:2-keto-4-pentenoate hydratase/2-oxohepta-3-ene-1,7-dioic acid hydratase in catechol pathway